MVLKSYFDGGNKDDSSQYATVSLACVAAIDSDWLPFERDWRIMLQRFFGDRHQEPHLHTVDAVTGNGVYEGWGAEKTQDFLADCVRVALDHFIQAKKPETGFAGRYGLYGCVITINLEDFLEHAGTAADAPQNANEVLLRQTLTHLLPWSQLGADPPCDECHCTFDQGEPFYGHLDDILTRKKAKQDATLLANITSRTKANMRRVPALQLADLLAWSQSHKFDENKPAWLEGILKADCDREWFDRDSIKSLPDQQAVWKTWKVNRRSPTR
jgi:hypothetical protein